MLTVDKSFIPYSPEYLDDSGNPKWMEYIHDGDEDGLDVNYRFENVQLEIVDRDNGSLVSESFDVLLINNI